LKKETARKIYQKKRQELSSLQFEEDSSQIIRNLIKLIKKFKPTCIHCFLTINQKSEINTKPIIEYCWENHIDVVVPITDFTNNTLKNAKFDPSTKTALIKNNIPEPINPIWANDSVIELVITPLLAFDATGHRIGFGRGFYDRLFLSLHDEVKRVGVSFFEPCENLEDVDNYDVPLTHCVTPQPSYYFKKDKYFLEYTEQE
jgi:5-formyltetrahydrofolate cyclo-ligase